MKSHHPFSDAGLFPSPRSKNKAKESKRTSSDLLKSHLVNHELSRAEFANRIGVTANAVGKWMTSGEMPYWVGSFILVENELAEAKLQERNRILLVSGSGTQMHAVKMICDQMGVSALTLKGGQE